MIRPRPTDTYRFSLFLIKGNRNRDSAHHVFELEIPFRTERVGVVAGYTSGGHGSVRVDRLIVAFLSAGDDAGNGTICLATECLQGLPLEFRGGPVSLIDGKETDESEPDTASSLGDNAA